MPKTKYKLRVLPAFIFVAVLTLSVKVTTVFESLVTPDAAKVVITHRRAYAEEAATVVAKDTSLNNIVKQEYDGVNLKGISEQSSSSAEIQILKDLTERRELLDIKSKEIDKRSLQLKVAEEEIAKKVEQLKVYEEKLKRMIGEYNAKEKEKLDSLVKMYSSMKPKDAARIFNTLDIDIVVPILQGMKPSSSSSVLSQMDAQKAKAITSELMGNNF